MKSVSKFCTICLFHLLLATTVFSQELDMDCRPIMLPAQCGQIESDLRNAEAAYLAEIRELQADLREAPPGRKSQIAGMINRVRQNMARDPQIRALRQDLANCRRQFDTAPRRPVAPAVLNTVFSGTARGVTTSGLTGGAMRPTAALPFTANLLFSTNRCSVTVSNLTVTPFTPPTTSAVVTVERTSGGTGSFFPVTGIFSMPMGILYNYNSPPIPNDSISVIFTTGTSASPSGAINITGMALSTTPAGMTIDQCGQTVNGSLVTCSVTLVGTGVFSGSILGGSEGGLTLTGTIARPPAPIQPVQTRAKCLADCNLEFSTCRRDGGTLQMCNREKTECRAQCP